jgi:hypothetical protein
MYEGRCHCGAVRWTYRGEPDHVTSCNCSLCRRTMALMAYGTVETVTVEGPTVPYVQGDRGLAMHHCPTCGITTHWSSLVPAGEEGHGRMAVNTRLAEPGTMDHVRVRRFDGAESWTFLD